LQDAVQGKLVEQNKMDEPASELLNKIKAEKEQLIAENLPASKAGKLKKEKELSPIKREEIPFEIPENWVWCRLGDLCIEILGGYAFDSTRYSKMETQNQVIRLGNVKPNQLVLETTPVFIDDDYAKEALRASLIEGDILITMTGTRAKKDYLFTLCLTKSDLQTKNLFLNQRVGCFRFGLFMVNSYINIALKDVRLLNAVFESSTGAANQANIGIAALKDILIPLPPLAEQNRIVQKIDELVQYCNELEASIKQSELQNEKLLQQVLREVLRKEPIGV
jgi:type I restriction enzyme S subunit